MNPSGHKYDGCEDCRAYAAYKARRRRQSPPEVYTHGASGYSNYGCRCDTCRAGWNERVRAYMASHPEQREKARLREAERRRNSKWRFEYQKC